MTVREFMLPDLGEGLEDAEIVAWRVAEGETVELNQTLVEVNTAKALVEIPSPWDGLIEKLHGGEGDVITVGEALVSIRVADGAEERPPHESEKSQKETQNETSPEQQGVQAAMEAGPTAADEARPKRRAVLVGYGVAEDAAPAPVSRRTPGRARRSADQKGPVPASPPVRRLAKELGIDIATVDGSGPAGRVTREDVLEAAERSGSVRASAEIDTSGETRIPVRGTRRLVAEKMARSAREIPHVTTFLTVDCHWLNRLREEIERRSGTRISPLPIVVRALAETCREHHLLNASFDADSQEIVAYHSCHAGIATDTEQGLVVTVVRDVGIRGIIELHETIGRLAEQARTGKARPQDLVGSTVTVSNVGSFGAEYGTPIINYPESSILAIGVIEDRALVVDEEVVARPACIISLSFDHRVMDGAQAGRALRALGDLLENPLRLGALPL